MTAGASNGEDTKKGDLKKNDAVKHKKPQNHDINFSPV
jgi:hypothetical protein